MFSGFIPFMMLCKLRVEVILFERKIINFIKGDNVAFCMIIKMMSIVAVSRYCFLVQLNESRRKVI